MHYSNFVRFNSSVLYAKVTSILELTYHPFVIETKFLLYPSTDQIGFSWLSAQEVDSSLLMREREMIG